MERVTDKMIEARMKTLSDLTGERFALNKAYGKTGVDILCENGGTITLIHLNTKRYTFDLLDAFITGYQSARDGKVYRV